MRVGLVRAIAGRYRLTLHLDGQRVLDGWWNDLGNARGQFKTIVGSHGREGARVILVDTETDEEVAVWPEEE